MGKITGITLFMASLLALQSCIPFHSNLPNIIYIYADDLGYGELGCYGQDKIRTPHLDRLASDGIRFTQHYTGAPVCAPARCMLMTGQHAGHSYIRLNVRKNPHAPWEIYNLEADPSESRDVAGEHPELAEQFNIIQQKEHRNAHIKEWEFIRPFFKNQ